MSVAVHKHQSEIELVLACVGELNTIMRNNVHWPLLYGAGNNIKFMLHFWEFKYF